LKKCSRSRDARDGSHGQQLKQQMLRLQCVQRSLQVQGRVQKQQRRLVLAVLVHSCWCSRLLLLVLRT
jgi:hypothetical protein